MKLRRRQVLSLLALTGATLPFAALPWLVVYWPGQDDPNHLAITHILARLADPTSHYHAYLRSTLSLRPYVLHYQLLLALAHVVSLATAQRLLSTALILGGPLALWALVRRSVPERAANVALAAPAITCGWALMKGFDGFVLGAELAVALLALTWPWAADADGASRPVRPPALTAAALLLLAGTLAHPFTPLLVTVAWVARRRPEWRRPQPWLQLTVILLPSLLLVVYALATTPPSVGAAAGVQLCEPSLESFASCPQPSLYVDYGAGLIPLAWDTLVQQGTFSRGELPFRLAAIAVAVVALAVAAFRRRQATTASHAGEATATADAALLRVLLALLVAFALLPHELPGRGFVFIPQRAFFFALFFLFAAAPLPAKVAAPLGLALALPVALFQLRGAERAGQRIADLVAAGATVTPGATLLPLGFAPQLEGASIRATRHAWGWLVLTRDVVTPYLFAAGSAPPYRFSGDRPLAYRQPFGPAFLPFVDESAAPFAAGRGDYARLLTAARGYDYVLADSPPPEFLTQIGTQATVAAHVGDAWLLQRRPSPSP